MKNSILVLLMIIIVSFQEVHLVCQHRYTISNCTCEVIQLKSQWISYECVGHSLVKMTAMLPNVTRVFKYRALERVVDLGSVDFSHLASLIELSITPAGGIKPNGPRLAPIEMHQMTVFYPLKDLHRLTINVVWHLKNDMSFLFSNLTRRLGTLDLCHTQQIDFDILIQSFSGFEKHNLGALRLHNIQTYQSASRRKLNLTELLHPFRNKGLGYLDISNNALEDIYPGLNLQTQSLHSFNAENNLLQDVARSGIMFDVLMHPHIAFASFGTQGYGISPRVLDQRAIHKRETRTLQNSRQSERLMSSVKLSSIGGTENDGLKSIQQCLDNLTNICGLFDPMCSEARRLFQESKNLTCLALYTYLPNLFSGIPCDTIPPFDELVDETCAGCLVIPMTGKIEGLELNNLNLYDTLNLFPFTSVNKSVCFHENNRLSLIDVAENKDHGYQDFSELLGFDYRNLNKIKVLKMSKIGLHSLRTAVCLSFPNLEHLDISENTAVFNKISMKTAFAECKNLKSLKLSYNSVQTIEASTFTSMVELRTLNLSNNRIAQFDTNLSYLMKLNKLDLSNNPLSLLPDSVAEDLNTIARSVKLSVDISGCDLICTCQSVSFLEWMLSKDHLIKFENENKTFCFNRDSKSVQLTSVKPNDVYEECRGQLYYTIRIIAITVPATTICIALIFFAYRKRWWFRYQIFLGRQVWKNLKKKEEAARPYEYDVFVSYNQRDHDWVEEVLQPKLEEENGLKLCLHHRDFMFGELITENIMTSIENSRKTLLVLSPNFLSSTWCQFEMQIAQNKLFSTGKDVLLLAVLKPLPKIGISRILKTLLEERTYIEWTDDEYGQKLFWGKLITAIDAPIKEPFDLSFEEVRHYHDDE